MTVSPTPSTPPRLSFGLFSDMHYAEKTHGDRFCGQSLTKLAACIRGLNDRGLDLAFNLGDSIDTKDTREDELGYVTAVRGETARFHGDVHTVLGNHDVTTLTKAEFIAAARPPGAAASYSFDRHDVHLVVLDSNCHEDGRDFAPGNFTWDKAWIAPEKIDWLEADLAAAHGRPAIVFCHGNIDAHARDGAPDPHCVRNHEPVRAVLEAAGTVRAVIQGHYHLGRTHVVNGIPYITLAAMVTGEADQHNAWAVGSVLDDGAVVIEGFGHQVSHPAPTTDQP